MAFLRDQALTDPEIAAAMLAGEQNRLVRQLTLFVEELRRLDVKEQEPAFEEVHSAFCNISREISAFASDLLAKDLSTEATRADRHPLQQAKISWMAWKNCSTR